MYLFLDVPFVLFGVRLHSFDALFLCNEFSLIWNEFFFKSLRVRLLVMLYRVTMPVLILTSLSVLLAVIAIFNVWIYEICCCWWAGRVTDGLSRQELEYTIIVNRGTAGQPQRKNGLFRFVNHFLQTQTRRKHWIWRARGVRRCKSNVGATKRGEATSFCVDERTLGPWIVGIRPRHVETRRKQVAGAGSSPEFVHNRC